MSIIFIIFNKVGELSVFLKAKANINTTEKRLAYLNEVFNHFRKSDDDFYLIRDNNQINAVKREKIVSVSIIGNMRYTLEYDIIEDGSFILKHMEE